MKDREIAASADDGCALRNRELVRTVNVNCAGGKSDGAALANLLLQAGASLYGRHAVTDAANLKKEQNKNLGFHVCRV